jgi:hypothetical protein
MARAALAGFALALAFPAAAQTPPRLLDPTTETVARVSGPWEANAAGGARKCRLQLSPRAAADRQMILGLTAACRAAIPALAAAFRWGLGEDGRIHLFRQDGAALIAFRRDGESFAGADGLTLAPVGGRVSEAPRAASVAATLNALSGETPAADAKRAALAGAYGIGRNEAAADCVVELKRLPGPRGQRGGMVWAASLQEPCADPGLVTFAPAGWRFDDDRIFLVAKRGHAIGFSAGRDGLWRKDPADGRPLWLKRR